MRVCLINNLYKPYTRGGAERVVELIVDRLQEAGHEVFIVTTQPIFKKFNIQYPVSNIQYINALYYNLSKLPKFLRLFWHLCDMFDVGSYFRVKAILKKEKPDVVMTHNLKGIGYLIPRAIKCLGIKHIHTLHDIQLLHPSGLMIHSKEKQVSSVASKMYASICKWLFGSPKVVISPSNWLLKMHNNKGFFEDSKKVLLANPSPPAPLHLTPRPPLLIRRGGEGGEVFRFLYVGQIEEHKGVLFLIKVFKMLCEDLEDANCELIIVGDGVLSKKLKVESEKLDVKDRIKFLGRVEHKDLQAMMLQCDALVVPSLCYENSPTVIYEALSTGLPVIASRIGGITELIHNTAGILFKPNNGGDLMYQMKWVMEHYEELQEIGKGGRAEIKQFSIDNYIKKLEDLIK